MAKKLSAKELNAIIKSYQPGFEIEDETAGLEEAVIADQSYVQAQARDLEYLTAKFLGTSTSRVARSADSSTPTQASKIVRVRPAATAANDAVGTGARKVYVVSTKERKVIGEQG